MAEETKVFTKNDELSEYEVYAVFSKRVVVSGEEQEYRSYESDNIRIAVKSDGALSVSNYNGEGFVYLYPDQLDHLQKALEAAIRQRETASNGV
jgi:hypothetical protein